MEVARKTFYAVLLMVIHCNISLGNESETEVPEYQKFCRVSGGDLLEPVKFAAYSCATCYRYMDATVFDNGTKLDWRRRFPTKLYNRNTGEYYEADCTNASNPIFRTFRTEHLGKLWMDCCRAAADCCRVMRTTPPTSGSDICPRTWDGWDCWPDTPSEVTIQQRCPSYIYFHSEPSDCSSYASKQCLPNGTWYRNLKGNEFSDYRKCGKSERLKILLQTHILTFGTSIVLLVPSLGIFFYFRQLKVLRIFMHKNLFISLLFTAIFVIIFESYFVMDNVRNPKNSIVEANTASCKLFYSMTKYFRLTSYTWMFCEGFYLHRLIAAAFAEQKSTIVFHIIGWGLPTIPVTIWAIVRKLFADDQCWTRPTRNFEWILFAPMLAALLVNFGFLLHIIQVLITKLRSSNTDEPTQFRRAVRATMVLIPLFGIHFLLLSYHPSEDCYFKQIYTIITYATDGLQGGIVSVIFCYLNNEVLFLLKRSYSRQKMVRNIGSVASSRKGRESRTSMSTHVDSFANDCNNVARRAMKL